MRFTYSPVKYNFNLNKIEIEEQKEILKIHENSTLSSSWLEAEDRTICFYVKQEEL